MSKNFETLYLVYSFISNNSSGVDEFSPARYHIRGVYHGRGAVDLSELQELAKSVTHENFMDLLFNSLDDIKTFADRLFQEYPAENLYLLSAQDFNLALEATSEASQLADNLKKYGEKLLNEEVSKTKGFFGRFFN